MSRVSFDQPGYSGCSRSLGAVDAEDRGLLPVSRITRKKGIRDRLSALGLTADEWHHVGRYAKRCDYWSAARVRAVARMTPAEFAGAVALHEARLLARREAGTTLAARIDHARTWMRRATEASTRARHREELAKLIRDLRC